jgi:hypothetical protein
MTGRVGAMAVAMMVWVSVSTAVAEQSGPDRLVAVSNARLRAEPSEEVRILGTVPLGEHLTDVGSTDDGTWRRVRTTDGREGWMLEALTRRVRPGEYLRTVETIILGRLRRQGDGFAALMEVESFIDRVRQDLPDRAAAARFALYRLRAIQMIARAGERYHRPLAPAFAVWLDAHRTMLVRNEPGGAWLVRRDVILAEHDLYKEERAGDEIAWLAVTIGLPGECEGEAGCYLRWSDFLEGEYLRRVPAGAFVESALRQLRERVTWIREGTIEPPNAPSHGVDCQVLRDESAPVRAAVAGAQPRWPGAQYERDRTLAAFDQLLAHCR